MSSTLRNFIAAARDTFIIFWITFLLGIGLALYLDHAGNSNDFLSYVAPLNVIVLPVLLGVSGALSSKRRWKHLLLVALMMWPAGLLNIVVIPGDLGTKLLTWVSSIFFLLACALIGGLLSYIPDIARHLLK